MSNPQDYNQNPSLVLAVDTASISASFAVCRGAETISSLSTDAHAPHSKIFFDRIALLLRGAGLSLSEIDAFAAATGPGSFTGLRVGLSAIKGLSHSLNKPVVGVNSIDAVALAAKARGKILSLIDAGRGDVFAGFRSIHSDGIPHPAGLDTLVGISALPQFSDKYMKGESGVVAYLGNNFLDQILFDHQWKKVSITANLAEEIAILAAKRLKAAPIYPLIPHYIRPSDAELNHAVPSRV